MTPKILPLILLLLFGLSSQTVKCFRCDSTLRRTFPTLTSPLMDMYRLKPAFWALSAEPNSNDDETPRTTQPKDIPLDPLFKAVTRSGPSADAAKTLQVPLFGELSLDQSLFILLPIVAFAILGIITSIVVLINSTDEFATAIQNQQVSASASAVDPSTCRGLCSNNNNDVDSLRQYMMGISGKTAK